MMKMIRTIGITRKNENHVSHDDNKNDKNINNENKINRREQ